MKLKEIQVPDLSIAPGMTNVRVYVIDNGLTVIYSENITLMWGKLKHISISHRKRLPFWHDILEIKKELMGDIDAMMVMPKTGDYINLHKFCFHIWQCPEGWNMQ